MSTFLWAYDRWDVSLLEELKTFPQMSQGLWLGGWWTSSMCLRRCLDVMNLKQCGHSLAPSNNQVTSSLVWILYDRCFCEPASYLLRKTLCHREDRGLDFCFRRVCPRNGLKCSDSFSHKCHRIPVCSAIFHRISSYSHCCIAFS